MLSTLDGGYSKWELITTLDKKKLNILDNGQYIFLFFKDGSYPYINQEKIIRPYSFLPKKPLVQAITRNVMIYGNFKAGFADVPVDAGITTNYTDLAIDTAVNNILNKPKIISETN